MVACLSTDPVPWATVSSVFVNTPEAAVDSALEERTHALHGMRLRGR